MRGFGRHAGSCLHVNVVHEAGMFNVRFEGDGDGPKGNVEVELVVSPWIV